MGDLVSVLGVDLCQGLFLVVAFDELARSRSLTVFCHEFDIHGLPFSSLILRSCWRGICLRWIFLLKCWVISIFDFIRLSLIIFIVRILSTHLSHFCSWLVDWFLMKERLCFDFFCVTDYTGLIIISSLINTLLISFLVSFPKFRLLYCYKCVIWLTSSPLECFLWGLVEVAHGCGCSGTLLKLEWVRQARSVHLEEIASSSKWCCWLESRIIPRLWNIALTLT